MSDDVDHRHTVNESADKIRLKTQLTRGEGTRDQDKIEVKVKSDSPEEAVVNLNRALEALEATADTVRNIQPEVSDESDE